MAQEHVAREPQGSCREKKTIVHAGIVTCHRGKNGVVTGFWASMPSAKVCAIRKGVTAWTPNPWKAGSFIGRGGMLLLSSNVPFGPSSSRSPEVSARPQSACRFSPSNLIRRLFLQVKP